MPVFKRERGSTRGAAGVRTRFAALAAHLDGQLQDRDVFHAAPAAAVAQQGNPDGYTYAIASKSLPQTLGGSIPFNGPEGLYLSLAARENKQRLVSCTPRFRGMDHPLSFSRRPPGRPPAAGLRFPWR
jgi:hypothetical protein